MKKIKVIITALTIVLISSCTSSGKISQSATTSKNVISDAKILMAAYQQRAAEYRALCYQAYNIARLRLDNFVTLETSKPKAIMTDIDETILDNSPYQVHQALQGKDYDDKTWHEWTDRADADTVPGAVSFFQYAASKGIEIFYVTNRDEKERISTLANLKKFGFPFADNAHLKLKTTTSSKQPRRDSIEMHFDLIMQIGDNLNDMNVAFEKQSVEERFRVTDNLRKDFGDRYIVLPNPSYGEWENALYKYNFKLTPAQKDSVLRLQLKNY